MKKVLFGLALMVLTSTANAEVVIKTSQMYLGGGIGFNSLAAAGSARGFQIVGGYEFATKLNEDITSAVELGYMDSGDFDQLNSSTNIDAAKGVWLAYVGSVPLTSKTDVLARVGFDFGDDDGVLLGTGMQYKFTTKVAMRMEYVARQNVNSLQANVLFKF
jgi:opacity protein-like surface antigen